MTDLLSPEPDWWTPPSDRGGRPPEHPGWASIPDEPEADEVIVRRNGRISVVLAGVSALLSAAYFARAITSSARSSTGCSASGWPGSPGRTSSPSSTRGCRCWSRTRTASGSGSAGPGGGWRGHDLEEVEYAPRRHVVRDGRLVLFPRELEGELAMLGPAGQTARPAHRPDCSVRRSPCRSASPPGCSVPHGDLTGALAALADGRCEIVEVVPAARRRRGTRPRRSLRLLRAGRRARRRRGARRARGRRAAGRRRGGRQPDAEPAARRTSRGRAPTSSATATGCRRPPSPSSDPGDPERHHDLRHRRPGRRSPTVDPVIGPQLATARERLRLSIDQLADRTRIRPHVIEAIEIDDFAPCGGDFYARGHLRTLARVLGVDVAPLLATYDEKYADAPIDPRRVFEAELATGRAGPIRGTRGGPNWSVIVAAVMTVVLAWSVARLVMDHPTTASPSSPSLADGSAGLTSGGQAAAPVPVVLTAAGGGAHVVVRDGSGKVVFTGSLAFGQTQHPAGLAAGPDPVHRRLARGERRRPGPRRHRQDRPARPGRVHGRSAERARDVTRRSRRLAARWRSPPVVSLAVRRAGDSTAGRDRFALPTRVGTLARVSQRCRSPW